MSSPSIRVGSVSITAIADGGAVFPMTLPTLYQGYVAEDWAPFRERFPEAFVGEDGLCLEYNSYLLQTERHTVLVDTGIGPRKSPLLGDAGGHLPARLEDAGVAPENVDIVFLTHLHFDHIGWNMTAAGEAMFPRARYVVHRGDWDHFTDPALLATPYGGSIRESVLPLEALGRLEFLDGEKSLTPELTAIHTPGHTNGHMSLLVASSAEKAVVTGDVVGHPAQVTNPRWSEVFDTDRDLAAATRQALLDRIESEGMRMAAGHFPGPGFGHILGLNGKRYFQAMS